MAKKLKKNITGLRNQSKKKIVSHVKEASNNGTKATEVPSTHPVTHTDFDEQPNNDEECDAHIELDSNKLCWEPASDDEDEEEVSEEEDTDNENGDVEVIEAGTDEWRGEALHVSLMVLAIEIGDNPQDEDWIPDSLRRRHAVRCARGEFEIGLQVLIVIDLEKPSFSSATPKILQERPRCWQQVRTNKISLQECAERPTDARELWIHASQTSIWLVSCSNITWNEFCPPGWTDRGPN